MAETHAYGIPPGLFARHHYGHLGLGVLGSTISPDGLDGPGPFYACLDLPADADSEIFAQITVPPSAGTLFVRETGEMDFYAAGVPDGVYPVQFNLKQDGVDKGNGTFYITVGSVVGTISGNATLDDLGASGGLTGGAVSQVSGSATLDDIGASGQIVGGQASLLSGNATLGDVGSSGQAVGNVVLGSLAGSTRKTGALRPRNIQTSRR